MSWQNDPAGADSAPRRLVIFHKFLLRQSIRIKVDAGLIGIIGKRAHPADPLGPLRRKKDINGIGKPIARADPIGNAYPSGNAKIGRVDPHQLFTVTDDYSKVLFHLHFLSENQDAGGKFPRYPFFLLFGGHLKELFLRDDRDSQKTTSLFIASHRARYPASSNHL